LAPVQARLVPITEQHQGYCVEFLNELKKLGYRVDIDDRNEKMGLKTREAQMAKIPFTLVAGDREVEQGIFFVRKYGAKDSQGMTKQELMNLFAELENQSKL
jgi:threonyl-tRNA synthetase